MVALNEKRRLVHRVDIRTLGGRMTSSPAHSVPNQRVNTTSPHPGLPQRRSDYLYYYGSVFLAENVPEGLSCRDVPGNGDIRQ